MLCLNGEQIAYGVPGEVLTRAVLERTYGSEIVVLDSGGTAVPAVAMRHHEH